MVRLCHRSNTISTDFHDQNMNGAIIDMSNVLSKFITIGMSLWDVILWSTWNTANVIKRPDLEHINPGSKADVAVFSIRKGNFGYTDVRRNRNNGTEKLEA